MSSIRKVRYNLSKTKLRVPLTWFRNRGLCSSDVFIASYPRSGSTWLRFMLFEILTGQPAQFEIVNRSIPYVGKHHKGPQLLPAGGRLIKTHEKYCRFYKKAVYLVRDVRNVAISYYAYLRRRGVCEKEFDDFLVDFLKGKTHAFGSWADHVNQWLDTHANLSNNIIFIKFEDMRQKPEETLALILDFLGVQAPPNIVKYSVQNNTIERMREKEDRDSHIFKVPRKDIRIVNKGLIGGWKETLTKHQELLIDEFAGPTLTRLGYPGSIELE